MEEKKSNIWVGVDLDGTLAKYDGWKGAKHIGEPVPVMLERVKIWLAEGVDVRIFTARASSNNPEREESIAAIKAWCFKHLGTFLPITAEKDFHMVELWDDRCVQVVPNKGISVEELYKQLLTQQHNAFVMGIPPIINHN